MNFSADDEKWQLQKNDVEQIVQEILADMPPKEKAAIAIIEAMILCPV